MKGYVAKSGKSFKNRVDYILKDDHDFICSNMSADKNNVSDLTDEFKTVSSFRQDIKKPVFHAFLSVPLNEKLTDEQWQEIAKDYLKEMNIDIGKNQYICVRHKDTDKDHIHIVANRVALDGSVWHGQHSAFNTIAACERLEVKHGLTITQGLKGQKSEVSAPTKAEIEMALRTGEKPARIVLQNALQAAMLGKPDLQTFIDRVQAVGIEPQFNVASTGNVAGVSFSVNDIAFKGSSLGKKFSWNTIKTKVKYDKNRDDELVRRFAARKADDENSIRRSSIESDFNDSRAVDGINDDIIGVSKHSIKPDTTDTNKSEQLIRSNNNSFKLSEKYNRPASHKVRRTTQKAAQILNRVKKQYNKEPIKTYNKSSFNRGSNTFSGSSISRILDHAETATTATNNFRLRGRSSFNSRATTIEEIRERTGIKKPVIQPKNKEKVIVKEEIKKKPSGLSMNENRFKSKLKEAIKKEKPKNETTQLQQEDDQHLKPRGFKL
ncbi:relaxase/mobilization nuclease domain-containing protein [Pectobacterium brasiliense]|uniref:relaxase/mobilization nuclease domain-containing protein n=1 Tax=Pectobacterium brasiliense TaxID=180957 RepID=UPI0039861E0A